MNKPLRPVYTSRPRPRLRSRPSQVYIVLIVTGRLTGRMGREPILPVRQPVTIGTIIKLDGDGDGIGDGVGMCKQAFTTCIRICSQDGLLQFPESTSSTRRNVIENTAIKKHDRSEVLCEKIPLTQYAEFSSRTIMHRV